LQRAPAYADLGDKIKAFTEFETWAATQGKTAKSIKLDQHLPGIIEYIKSTDAFKRMQAADHSSTRLRKKDLLRKHADEFAHLVSFDIVQANYNTLKLFDSYEVPELGATWEALCEALGIHPTLTMSKSFRQVVFGNCNPKRITSLQHLAIMNFVNNALMSEVKESEIVFISHDEVVFDVADSTELLHLAQSSALPMKRTRLHFDRIPGGYVKTVDGVRSLHGVPGNKFFMRFKKHILGEAFEDRDLQFELDGGLATWQASEFHK